MIDLLKRQSLYELYNRGQSNVVAALHSEHHSPLLIKYRVGDSKQ